MSKREEIRRVRGFYDLLGRDLEATQGLQGTLRELFASYGYTPIDTPLLEQTELFLRRSGGEMASRMYTFSEPGGYKVSLRPEFTSPVIRAYLEGESLPLPVRWQYVGPVFRYENLGQSRYRQVIQQGIELIGPASPRADAEVITLACGGVSSVGITGHRLTLGHNGVILGLLGGLGLSERLKMFLVASIAELKKGAEGVEKTREQVRELGFLSGPMGSLSNGFASGVDGAKAQEMVRSLLIGLGGSATGAREANDIVARLLRKMEGADDPGQVERALTFMSQLSFIHGTTSEALSDARNLAAQYGLDLSTVDKLARIVALLEDTDLAGTSLTVDFGLARGFAYYTGVVFEIHHPAASGDQRICGGGRYDGLIKALGGAQDTPALGFAFGVERLREVLEAQATPCGEENAPEVLVIPASDNAYRLALAAAGKLRQQGKRVELDLEGLDVETGKAYAQKRGIPRIVVVADGGDKADYEIGATREGGYASVRNS